jgi:hypothetical protein
MNVDDLSELYRAKTDEELLHLANEWGLLTAEAQSILKGELSKRQIEIPRVSFPQEQNTGWKPIAQSPQAARVLAIGEFMPAVLRLYRNHMWLFVKVTAPAVVLTTTTLLIGRYEIHQMARQVLRGSDSLVRYPRLLLEATLMGLIRGLVSWYAFCFCFGVITVLVELIESGYAASISEFLQAVRHRLGHFLRLCLLLAVIFSAIEVIVSLIAIAVSWSLAQVHFHPRGLAYWFQIYAFFGLGLLVFSRFALAIPAFVLDDLSVSESIFKSDELTRGKWLHSSILLTKSLVGGYVAGMAPFWLARWLPLGDLELSSWFPWFLTAASVLAVTLVEPVMFIGFSVLYLQSTAGEMSSVRTNATTA